MMTDMYKKVIFITSVWLLFNTYLHMMNVQCQTFTSTESLNKKYTLILQKLLERWSQITLESNKKESNTTCRKVPAAHSTAVQNLEVVNLNGKLFMINLVLIVRVDDGFTPPIRKQIRTPFILLTTETAQSICVHGFLQSILLLP